MACWGQASRARRESGWAAVAATVAMVMVVGCVPPEPPTGPTTPDSQAVAEAALSLPPRVPGDVDLFTSQFLPGPWDGTYPDGAPMAPADGAAPTDAATRAELAALVSANRCSGTDIDAALAVYDSAPTRTMIPDHGLRAAYASLAGTMWQPTMAYMDPAIFNPVRFGGLGVGNVARVSGLSYPYEFVINRRYQYEDWRLLRSVMLHELLHNALPDSVAEEALLNTFTAMAHLQLLCDDPALAYENTELTRHMNDRWGLHFLNSRELGSPASEIWAPTGLGTAPGSAASQNDYWHVVEADGVYPTAPSPTSDAANQILQHLGLSTTTMFDQTAAESFENLNDTWLSDIERARISVLLQLVTVDEIATAADLTAAEVIQALELAPILAIIDSNE